MVTKTCVIGGGGFVGSHLVDELINAGREVIVLGRKAHPSYALNSESAYIQCDFSDRIKLREVLQMVDEVVDLAYSTVPKTSFLDPIFDLQSNLPSSVGLIEEVCELPKIKKMLFVSSGGTVYGDAQRLPITEEATNAPVSPYGITKLTIERYLLMYHKLRGLPAIVVRPSNAYGLGQQPFTGQGFIATAIGTILAGAPVPIFGTSGTVRDYIHVRDMARGIAAALFSGVAGEVYNIGSGIGRSNRDVLETITPIAQADGFSVAVEVQAKRGFDVDANVLNFGKLLACSGWLPKTNFEDGIAEMWTHLKLAPKQIQ